MKKEWQKSYNLDLYDFCIEVAANPANGRDLAKRFERTEKYVERKIKKLRQLSVKIKSVVYGGWGKKGSFSRYEFEEPIMSILEKLDRSFGMPELYIKSLLSEQEQEDIVNTIIRVNSNGKHWGDYFSNPLTRNERLQVILPFCLEHILFKEPEEVRQSDIISLGLKPALRYFNDSILRFLQVAYPWLCKSDRIDQKKELGNLIKNRLKELGKTQRQLSGEIGVSKCTISSYVNGRSFPTRSNLEKIFKVLDLSDKMTEILNQIPNEENNLENLEETIKEVGKILKKYCREEDLNLRRH
jgi:transcriptional regulator with XRE-family HTH domain